MEETPLEGRLLMLEDKYNMSTVPEIGEGGTQPTFSLGKVHIFNNQQFDDLPDSQELPNRKGSEKDVENLKETFKKLNFPEPQIHQDLNLVSFIQVIQNIAEDKNDELKKCRSLVCVFLSHGKDKYIYMKDGKARVAFIYEQLSNNKNLLDKPKIFIFQACRGSQNNNPIFGNKTESEKKVTARASSDVERDARVVNVESCFDPDGVSGGTPRGADCLTAYATTKGYVSFRNTEKGSWFIQNLCEVLQDYAAGKYDQYRPDIVKLLTLVSAEVSRKSEPYPTQPQKIAKQMPSFVSTLRKELFFREYN